MATPVQSQGDADQSRSLWDAVCALSDTDQHQLLGYATWRIKALGPRSNGLIPRELLHEAMVRLAEGRRTLPENLQLKDVLIGVMRSVASAWGQRSEQRLVTPISFECMGDQRRPSLVPSHAIDEITPERIVAAQQRLDAIHINLQGDALALTIVKGWEFGMTSPEIQRSMNVSEKEFRAAEKRVRRLLTKLEADNA